MTLDSIIKKNAGFQISVYGPLTLQIMATLGWDTVINKNEKIVFYHYDALANQGSVPDYVHASIAKEVGIPDVVAENDVKSTNLSIHHSFE